MSKNPLISIITINLNNLEGLKKTMTSVLSQTWKGFEYMVIDGASTDGSKEFIKEKAAALDYWISEPDMGIYHAMNKGIKESKGEYLLFLNSGDWLYEKDLLSKIHHEFLKDYQFIYGDIVKVSRDGSSYIEKGKSDITLKTFFEGSLNHQALFINQTVFKQFGMYDENLKIVSDWKITLIALGLNDSSIKYINQIISFYKLEGMSINFRKRDFERKLVIQELLPLSITKDYETFLTKNSMIQTNRYKMFLEMEKYRFAKKVNSAIYRILLALFTGKTLKDLGES